MGLSQNGDIYTYIYITKSWLFGTGNNYENPWMVKTNMTSALFVKTTPGQFPPAACPRQASKTLEKGIVRMLS